MNKQDLAEWLQTLGRAWETADAELAASLFDTEVVYQETPFDPPLQGFAAVRLYWLDNLATQRKVKFEGWVLAVDGDVGVVNWKVEFERVPSGEQVRLDGVSAGRFRAGKPIEWREWWHLEENRADG